jgi:hypothetical protein
LLAADASEDGQNPWPELAHYDCFACHQNLRPRSFTRDDAGPELGSLVPAGWFTASWPGVEALTGRDGSKPAVLDEVRSALARPHGDRRSIAASAELAAKNFVEQTTALDRRTCTSQALAAALERMVAGQASGGQLRWEEAAQWYLAACAWLDQHRQETGATPRAVEAALVELRELLAPVPSAGKKAPLRGLLATPQRFEPRSVREKIEVVLRAIQALRR